jgi:predicted HAD superfamily phosphohydrolase
MNREMELLSPAQRAAVLRVIESAKAQPGRQMEDVSDLVSDRDEAYAYQGAGGIHWGFNGGEHGFCIARGKVAP